MRPLPFDMTPLAKAMGTPTAKAAAPRAEASALPRAREEKLEAEAPRASKPAPARSRAAERSARHPAERRTAVFPQHLSPNAGWLSTLAKEQMHALATHTLARHTEQGMRTLTVTSALAGEGKTTVALGLADKLASAGKRILLIDLDIHRGTLSREASLEDLPGALESSDPSAVGASPLHTYPTNCRGVSIMPTGRTHITEGRLPLMSPDRITTLVQAGLQEHDLVLLDCPPLLPVADTHVIGEIVDNAILVVRAGSTPREVLNQAIDEFGKDKFMAAVLNRAQPHNIPYFHQVYGYYRRNPAKPE